MKILTVGWEDPDIMQFLLKNNKIFKTFPLGLCAKSSVSHYFLEF